VKAQLVNNPLVIKAAAHAFISVVFVMSIYLAYRVIGQIDRRRELA
jgi:hypothetical protein